MNNRIKKLRRELDLTQEKFGSRIGVKGNTVAQWESGRNEPPASAITFIEKEFGVNEEWLRTGAGEMFKPSPSSVLDALAAEYGLDSGSRIAIEKFVKLSPELRTGMLTYFKEVTAAVESADAPEQSDTAAAEAAYEKSLGIARSRDSTVSNTTDGTEEAG